MATRCSLHIGTRGTFYNHVRMRRCPKGCCKTREVTIRLSTSAMNPDDLIHALSYPGAKNLDVVYSVEIEGCAKPLVPSWEDDDSEEVFVRWYD